MVNGGEKGTKLYNLWTGWKVGKMLYDKLSFDPVEQFKVLLLLHSLLPVSCSQLVLVLLVLRLWGAFAEGVS